MQWSLRHLSKFMRTINRFKGEESNEAEEIEKALTSAYDTHYEDNIAKEMNDWTNSWEDNIFFGLLDRFERNAFTNHFEEFKSTIYKDISNNVVDLEKAAKGDFKITVSITKTCMKMMNKEVAAENWKKARKVVL